MPPKRPAHPDKRLESATELSRDLTRVISYLEQGKSYYRAYQEGTHTVEENKRFLRFLETYEKELALAKKEAATLKRWVDEKGPLHSEPR